jgi:hypothetical protein
MTFELQALGDIIFLWETISHDPTKNREVNSGAPEKWAVPSPLVASVVLI